MKIVFYIESLYGGGAERVLVNLMNYLSDRGENVELVLNNKSGPYHSLLNESITVYVLDAKLIKRSIFELADYLNNKNPDFAVSTLHDCNFALILAGKLSRVNTRILVREANSFITKTQSLPLSRRLYERLKARLFYPLADKIFVNSEGSRRELVKVTGVTESSIEILPNPLDLNYIRDKANKDLPNNIAAFLKKKPYIVAAGRLVEAKGFDVLIRAFARLKDNEYRLIILGEGDKRSNLERLVEEIGIKSRVLMPGYVHNPYAIMGKADLFILSSRYEGMPNVLLEAMALELPIIATDCPSGPRELLKNGKFGHLVPVDDEIQLAEAMDRQMGGTLSHRRERREHIKQFDIENVGSTLYSLLQRLAI